MRDPEAPQREYDPLEYWKEPENFAAKGLTPAYWNDPWPELQGMLTSEHIRAYHDAVGRMIRPFDPAHLKTASYELTLGSRCLVQNEEKLLTAAEPRLSLPPNSLSFVSMEQVLYLPHYIVGRFDLAIDFIYQGLLLGTGPQVDPGFQGGLSCPLHNISNEEIFIELGRPFAKIDFAKTVPRPEAVRNAWSGIRTEAELARWVDEQGPESFSRVFKEGRPKWRMPIFGYLNGRRPTSSVKRLETDLNRLRNVAIGGFVGAVITILVGVPALILQTTDLFTHDLAKSATVTKIEVGLQRRDESLERQIWKLRGQQRQRDGTKYVSPTVSP